MYICVCMYVIHLCMYVYVCMSVRISVYARSGKSAPEHIYYRKALDRVCFRRGLLPLRATPLRPFCHLIIRAHIFRRKCAQSSHYVKRYGARAERGAGGLLPALHALALHPCNPAYARRPLAYARTEKILRSLFLKTNNKQHHHQTRSAAVT